MAYPSFRGCHSLLFRIHRSFDGLIHLAVSGATAEISAERAANFWLCWFWIFGKQMLDGHNESRSTVTALCSAPVAVSFLNCRETAVLAHALDRRNFLTFATSRQQRARHHRNTVDEYSAGAARGVVTAALGSGEVEVLPQYIEQQFARLECELVSAAVNAKFYEFFFH